MGKNKTIYVTQPALPPLDEFNRYLSEIWERKVITNNGPFHKQFEKELADYLGVKYISLFSNGTIALITALQALEIKGEVITTPFSFVATAHAIWWNNTKPVFSDIDPLTLNLDPSAIERAITPKTSAILPVHVYGYPCDVDRIEKIAEKHGLKVIYDAAHAFGVRKDGVSVLNYGDLSIMSFHATKVFNTIEGGAIVSPDEETKKRIDHLKNFGFAGETTVLEPGINGKMNELQAAYGLLQLRYVDGYISARKAVSDKYRSGLKGIPGLNFREEIENVVMSYSYFPVRIEKKLFGISRDELYEKLKAENIFCRRYFYPLISHFNPYSSLRSAGSDNLPVAEKVANEILCLPVYPALLSEDQELIIDLIRKAAQ